MTQITGISSNLALNQAEYQRPRQSVSKNIGADLSTSDSSIYVFLVNSLEIPEYSSGISKSDLTANLKSLIAQHSQENDNSDQIDLLTNVIADFGRLSAGGNLITQASVSSSRGFEV